MRDLLLKAFRSVLRAFRPHLRENDPPCVVVLQYSFPLGCCVHGTPLYAALKAGKPGLQVVVATRGLGAATIAHDPQVDLILETEDPMLSLRAIWRTATDIRRKLKNIGLRPQWVLQDVSNGRGRFALLAALLRIAPTVGFAGAPGLYDIHLATDDGISLIDNNLRLPATIFGAPRSHREPAVYFTATELARVRRLIAGDLETKEARKPIIAFAVQGSGGQPTAWVPDRYSAVIQHVEAKGYRTVFVGAHGDAASISTLLTAADSPGLNLAGRTSVAELSATLCLSDLLIAIDTGSMHVGRAAAVPLVVLATCWQHPIEWLPVGMKNARILRAEGIYPAPPDYHLEEIEVQAVTAATDELLDLFPPSPDARETRARRLLSSMRA